jgi:superfamily II DNA or RNA helicase
MTTTLGIHGYIIHKEALENDDLKHMKDELFVKPFNMMDMGGSNKDLSFAVYRESCSKIKIPKYYGLKHFGAPEKDDLECNIQKINLEFSGTLRPEQEAPVRTFIDAAKDKEKRGGIISLQCAAGKCLARDTLVVLWNGQLKKVQDIQVGEQLMGDDSKPRRVLSIARGREMMYTIRQTNGIKYTVNESHILSLKNVKTDGITDISIRDYIKLENAKKENLHGYKSVVYFPYKPITMKPYDYGVLLFSEGFVSKMDDRYIFNNVQVRLGVLAGIIDMRGTLTKRGFYLRFQEDEWEFYHQVRYIVHSLGCCSVKEGYYKYDMIIFGAALNEMPTITYQKQYVFDETSTLSKIRVEPYKEDDYYGFEIDGNRRFLLEDFTVTHNTVMALNIITQLSVKTLVVVHKEFLLNQWQERISQFIPDARVGFIKGSVCDVKDKDIVIGSLQSLSMKNYDPSVFSDFGFSIYDEVHHCAAQVFSRVFYKATTLYSLGLSATVSRKDGLTKVFKWHIGDIVYKNKKKADIMKIIVKDYYDTSILYCSQPVMLNKKPNISKMINNICEFLPRIQFIIENLQAILEDEPDRKVLLLSDRRKHLEMFHEELTKVGITSGYYYGGLKQDVLEKSEKQQVLLGTYAYVSEGFDMKGLNTLILASPKSDIIQSVGRILRDKIEDRQYEALVLDIVDKFSIFPNQAKKRIHYYQSQNYKIHKDEILSKIDENAFKGKCMISCYDDEPTDHS